MGEIEDDVHCVPGQVTEGNFSSLCDDLSSCLGGVVDDHLLLGNWLLLHSRSHCLSER